MNSKITAEAIIFDKDGTLIDFDAFWVTLSRVALRDILNRLLQPETLIGDILEAFGVRDGITDINGVLCKGTYQQMSQIVQRILLSNGCTVADDVIEQMVLDAYSRNAAAGDVQPTCPNLRTVLETFKTQGKKIALVTTDNREITQLCLEKLGILELFDQIYTDDGILPVKPQPDNAYDFCARTGLSGDQVVMVGDTMTDIRFARNAGIRVVGVARCREAREILTGQADAVVDSLAALPDILE